MRHPSFLRGLLVIAAAIGWLAGPKHALALRVSCVSNTTDFANELIDTGYYLDDFEIHLTEGTFAPGQGSVYENTRILGGYSLPDCASRSLVPGKTVITAAAGDYVRISSANSSNVTIDGVTFTAPFSSGPGTEYDFAGTITLSRDVFTGIGGNFGVVSIGFFQNDEVTDSVRIVDSLFVNNSVSSDCAIYLSSEWAFTTYTLINNTIMDNPNVTSAGVCVTEGTNPDFPAYTVLLAHDNIFWNNGGVDLYSNTAYMELVDNIIGSHQYDNLPLSTAPVGTTATNPQLDANYKPLPSPTSPTINTGEVDTGDITPTDLDGGPRLVGSHVDRGAYESNVDDATFLTVTNANDHGLGSLRDAINSANQNAGAGLHVIRFDIGNACGPQVIELETPLPQLTSIMFIDATTQAGYKPNSLETGDDANQCVILDGNANHIADGLYVPVGAPDGTLVTITGLAFGTFTHSAIGLYGGDGHILQGLRIGGGIGGVTLFPSENGIVVGPGVSNVSIGGNDKAQRNIVAVAGTDGIVLTGPNATLGAAHDNRVVNNYVGVGWNPNGGGYVDRGNTVNGIHVAGRNNTITDNLIGYDGNGIDLDGPDAHDNEILSNFIGIDGAGNAVGNPGYGVHVEGGAHDNAIKLNTIAKNLSGVSVLSGNRNTIRRNRIFQNAYVGIDLGDDGVTLNSDPNPGANAGQDYPILKLATGTHTEGLLVGAMGGADGSYTVDVYASTNCDDSGYGEGNRWLLSRNVTVASGIGPIRLSFTLPSTSPIGYGAQITTTATDSLGNTSEFSPCIDYVSDVIFGNGFDP